MTEMRGSADLEFEFRHDLGAPRMARGFLRQLLSGRPTWMADRVTLVASELVTNVIVHTGGGGTLRCWSSTPSAGVRLEVQDRDPASVENVAASSAVDESARRDRGGRGLSIVDWFSDVWGVDATAGGKTVWGEFNLSRRDVTASRGVLVNDLNRRPALHPRPAAASSRDDEDSFNTLLSLFDLRGDEMILRRERARLAALLEEHADEIAAHVTDPVSAVRFVAYLIRLNTGVHE